MHAAVHGIFIFQTATRMHTTQVYTLLERVLEKEQGQVILVIEPGTTDQDLFEDAPPVAQESTPAGHSEGERRSDNVETTHKASEDT